MLDKEQEIIGDFHVVAMSRPIDANFHQIDLNTWHWGSLEMMREYFKTQPFNKEEVLLMINNTIENGYKLTQS